MKINAKQITVIGALIAFQVIIGRYVSISLPTMKIGFSFLPWVVAAVLYGPVWGAVVGVLADFLVAILGPFGYFPPMAITALATGVIYGLFLYKKPLNLKRIVCCVVVQAILCTVLLQTLWLSMLMDKAYLILLPERLIQICVTIPVQVLCIRSIVPTVVNLIQTGSVHPAKQEAK